MAQNVIIAQAGGPSPVVNNSLRGVIDACKHFPETFGRLYAGWHGIEGVLKEELLDLGAQPEDELALLRTTPASGAIGTCRYRLRSAMEEDLRRLLDVFRAHGVGYFFYIGGNDSMDTASRIARLARDEGLGLVVTGIPKTIDNDLGDAAFKLIDHTPGYGSAARYWCDLIQEAEEENRGSAPVDPVLVLQAMGRRIGFLPAAARLADPRRETPLVILLAEAGLTVEDALDAISDTVRRHGRALVVASEGFDAGVPGGVRDPFGHVAFGASRQTVAQALVNLLNERGLPARGAARGQVPGTAQRHAIAAASTVDLDEAYRIGQQAVLTAREDGSGWMATLLRRPGLIYNVEYGMVALADVAGSERAFPREWIAPSRIDVTDGFLEYARPLVGEDRVSVPLLGGRQRFARLAPVFAEKKLPPYVPQGERTNAERGMRNVE